MTHLSSRFYEKRCTFVNIIIGLLFYVALGERSTEACTNFLFTRETTTDSSTVITYSADSHLLFGDLFFSSSETYNAYDSLSIYDWETGFYLGKIKQVKHTFQVVGHMNEYQLAIAETTFTGRTELQDSSGILDYGNLMILALQRAQTAREAIKVMTDLVNEYGYFTTGESFSIADPDEVWIMELIGKGKFEKGAVWVARRIPDGYVSGHANQARITTFPQHDPENCLYSQDVISFAREKGYFSGSDEEFSFADSYAPLNFEAARFCEARVWSGFRRINSNMDQYEDYALGYNLSNRMPLWIKPDKKLTIKEIMSLMRDYFEGTKMDMTQDIGAGPYQCIVRWRPLTWSYQDTVYFNERAISTQQTGFSFVTQSRNYMPDPIGGVLWFGLDDTYSTVYTPMFCGINRVPFSMMQGNGSLMEFNECSAFWVFNQVSNFAYTRYQDMIPFIREKQNQLEQKYLDEIKSIEKQACDLYPSHRKKTIKLLTAYSTSRGDYTTDEWRKLYHFLFTRFMDGNVKTSIPGSTLPQLEQPGYGVEWYRRIVSETGDRFLYREEPSH